MTQTISTIVSQHTEEAALCWLWRDRGVMQPHYLLSDVVNTDNQLEAHLDGLRVAGDEGWANCEVELRWQEPGEYFVAAVLALESADARRIELVLQGALEQDQLARAVALALGWLSLDQARPHIQRFVEASDSRLRTIGIAAAGIHRLDASDRLARAITDDDPLTRTRALRAVAELGRLDLVHAAADQLQSDDLECRSAAAFTVARFADADGQLDEKVESALCEAVNVARSGTARCLQTLMHHTKPQRASELIRGWFEDPRMQRCALTAAGLLGDPVVIPWLLDLFQTAPLARLAGEAFTMVTGLAIDERPFEGEWPDGFEAGPTEDPNDDNVELDADENLPWPNRATIADWWLKHRDDFQPGVRYLLGRPMNDEAWLRQVLREGYQRQRAAAALELGLRHPSEPIFEVRAPGRRQQQLLNKS